MTSRRTWTVNETAEILGIARQTAYNAINNGDIPSIRIGKLILIPRDALAALLGDPEPPDTHAPVN